MGNFFDLDNARQHELGQLVYYISQAVNYSLSDVVDSFAGLPVSIVSQYGKQIISLVSDANAGERFRSVYVAGLAEDFVFVILLFEVPAQSTINPPYCQ